jgi:hypothetical protein
MNRPAHLAIRLAADFEDDMRRCWLTPLSAACFMHASD